MIEDKMKYGIAPQFEVACEIYLDNKRGINPTFLELLQKFKDRFDKKQLSDYIDFLLDCNIIEIHAEETGENGKWNRVYQIPEGRPRVMIYEFIQHAYKDAPKIEEMCPCCGKVL